MATTQNGIFGRSSGSIGNVVTSTWKGLNVIKAKPIYVKRQYTPAELLNQAKIKAVSKAVSKIRENAKYIFNLGTTGTTAFAELQKLYRNRINFELLLDPALFSNTKTGTGNRNLSGFTIYNNTFDNFSVCIANIIGDNDILIQGCKFSILIVKDDLSRILFAKEVSYKEDDYVSIVPSDYGFEVGDNVLYAIKATLETPGQLLTTELIFSNEVDFIKLTA